MIRAVLCLSIFQIFFVYGDEAAPKKQTICLNMIVKDEKPVIQKCLESIKPWIDYWVIVDTGSTDGTQKAIREVMDGIPGELHEMPWVDFSTNRNQALDLARDKGDYSLRMDADEVFICPEALPFPRLEEDLYLIDIRLDKPDGFVSRTPNVFLIKNRAELRWRGPVHEEIFSSSSISTSFITSAYLQTDTISGHRAQDPKKYHKDAALLEKALLSDPNNPRHRFYLGISYELAGEDELALQALEKCVKIKDLHESYLFRALLELGLVRERMGKAPWICIESYQRAMELFPTRAEPIYSLGAYYANRLGKYEKGYEYFEKASTFSLPLCAGTIDEPVYTWASLFAMFRCMGQIIKQQKQEAREILNRLQKGDNVPPEVKEVVAIAALEYRK